MEKYLVNTSFHMKSNNCKWSLLEAHGTALSGRYWEVLVGLEDGQAPGSCCYFSESSPRRGHGGKPASERFPLVAGITPILFLYRRFHFRMCPLLGNRGFEGVTSKGEVMWIKVGPESYIQRLGSLKEEKTYREKTAT